MLWRIINIVIQKKLRCFEAVTMLQKNSSTSTKHSVWVLNEDIATGKLEIEDRE